MRSGLRFGAFVALAAGLHAAAFELRREPGAAAGGDGGATAATLAAPHPRLAALVAEWEQASAAAAEPAVLAPPVAAPQDLPAAVPPEVVPPAGPAVAEDVEATPAATAPSADEARPRPRPPDLDRPSPRVARAEPGAGAAGASGADGAEARARGSGERMAAGAASRGEAAGAGPDASAVAAWGSEIQRSLQRRLRTPATLRVPEGSSVVLSITVARDGRLERAALARRSGIAELDAAVARSLGRIGRLPGAPESFRGEAHPFAVPIVFR